MSKRTHQWRLAAIVLGAVTVLGVLTGCQAHAPRKGPTTTEDVSKVVYNYSWLKAKVLLRDLQVHRLDGDMLEVVARFHSAESHTSHEVCIKTEFYEGEMVNGGRMIEDTPWETFILEPRKSVHYSTSSMRPADDFRIYVTYAEDLGKN